MNFLKLLRDTKKWSLVMAGTLVLGVGWIYLSRVPRNITTGGGPPPSPREGFSAPDFTLDQLGGGEVTLSDLRGNVVVINLWASWCPPCRAEMPAIQSAYEKYRDRGLVVLAVNTTYQDDEAEAQAFVEGYGLDFPVLFDRTGEVSRQYQLRGLPSTFFVDRGGIIQSVVVGGPMDESLIRSKVEALLEEDS